MVDDEADIRNSVRRGLQAQGFDVETAVDGIDGLARIERWRPDVVLMDLAMPRMGGISAIQELRTWSDVPVIVLSVMGEEGEKVRALDAGADDYLTKPFGIQELGARVRVALRHMSLAQSDTIRELGSVSVDLSSRVVRVDRDEVHLSPIEYELLKHLVINAGRVLTHGQLLERVWGPEYRTETAYLRPIVTSLRKKLGPRFIRTEPGVGYRVPLETA